MSSDKRIVLGSRLPRLVLVDGWGGVWAISQDSALRWLLARARRPRTRCARSFWSAASHWGDRFEDLLPSLDSIVLHYGLGGRSWFICH